MQTDKAIVVTTIQQPNDVLRSISGAVEQYGYRFVVIGDEKSPDSFSLPNCDYFDIGAQERLPFKYSGVALKNHYSRKNIGYLEAIRKGAKVILETDDDNFPIEDFYHTFPSDTYSASLDALGWVNIYSYYSESNVWPRGFPLEFVKQKPPPLEELPIRQVCCPIQQGLADHMPDVDAVFNLVGEMPQYFDRTVPNIALSAKSWCPFNSQNTRWLESAFPLLYLPATCSFRMTDIWRSFVAHRIAWENEWSVLFTKPTVKQERNEHNLIKDFTDEIEGYLNNTSITSQLEKINLEPGESNIAKNLKKCYQLLVDLELIRSEELVLLDAWLDDICLLNINKSVSSSSMVMA